MCGPDSADQSVEGMVACASCDEALQCPDAPPCDCTPAARVHSYWHAVHISYQRSCCARGRVAFDHAACRFDAKAVDSLFSELDADGGGELDPRELMAGLKKLKSRTVQVERRGAEAKRTAAVCREHAAAALEAADWVLAADEISAKLEQLRNNVPAEVRWACTHTLHASVVEDPLKLQRFLYLSRRIVPCSGNLYQPFVSRTALARMIYMSIATPFLPVTLCADSITRAHL